MIAGSWYSVCERLCAGQVEIDTDHTLFAIPLVTAAEDLDVNMADSPFLHTASTGKKRSRDDEYDEDAFEYDMRLEKVRDDDS